MLIPAKNPRVLKLARGHFSAYFDSSFINDHSIQIPNSFAAASEKRIKEFVGGRLCARAALRQLGAPEEVGMDIDGRPVWPSGYIGSITHTNTFVSAAASPTTELKGLGIDSEEVFDSFTASDLLPTLMRASEIRNLSLLNMVSDQRMLYTLVFSAKESIYKCLNPLVHQFLDFKDLEITGISMENGQFEYKLLRNISNTFPAGFSHRGSFEIADDRVHTAVELSQISSSSGYMKFKSSP